VWIKYVNGNPYKGQVCTTLSTSAGSDRVKAAATGKVVDGVGVEAVPAVLSAVLKGSCWLRADCAVLQVWPGEVVYPSYMGDKAAGWLKSQMKNMYDQVPFGEYGFAPLQAHIIHCRLGCVVMCWILT
jgi:hypothetical protein